MIGTMRIVWATITARRPANRLTASAAPSGKPRTVASSTAERLTSRLRSTMRHSSASSWNTRCNPSAIALSICGRVSPARTDEQKRASRGYLLRGAHLLAEARLHQLRWACGADRDHAPGPGGREKVDRGAALPACAQLLHAAART